METRKIILDSDILIEIAEDKPRKKIIFEKINELKVSHIYISSITFAELLTGAINKNHQNLLLQHLSRYSVLHINEEISHRFLQFMIQYKLSHNSQIDDLLIAATSIFYDIPLYTFNSKDFKYIPYLKLIK